MTWVRRVSAQLDDPPATVGGKASGLAELHRLGLPVPDAVVVTTEACRAFVRTGRLPDGLMREVTAAVDALHTAAVSVRSGAATSMPGMMNTILDLAPECVEQALREVFASWDAPRAHTYRELHGIPHDLGTAAIVQVMVHGDRNQHSGSGVVFSRDPNTGQPEPFGEVLFGRRGDDIVSGRAATRPVADLAAREPAVWADLTDALARIERHLHDACYVEFTYESGRLWLLQLRSGQFTGRAAVRLAVDLADEGVIDRRDALLRVTADHLERARTPRIVVADNDIVLGHGVGACPGVVAGAVATTSDSAVRQAATGPVVLVRPETSPHDMRGLAAAAGIVTALGGPACHAAVVARALGRPAVVGATHLTVDATAATVSAGDRTIDDGTVITIDGTTGQIVLGHARTVTDEVDEHQRRLLDWADDASGDRSARPGPQRLGAAHAALQEES